MHQARQYRGHKSKPRKKQLTHHQTTPR
jgi:hypothetical protein